MKVADGELICVECGARRYVDLKDPPEKCHMCGSKKRTLEEL